MLKNTSSIGIFWSYTHVRLDKALGLTKFFVLLITFLLTLLAGFILSLQKSIGGGGGDNKYARKLHLHLNLTESVFQTKNRIKLWY